METKFIEGHSESISSVEFSPNGELVLTSSRDKKIKIWNLISGQEVLTMHGHENPISSAVFSPDGQFVLSGSEGGEVMLWDATDGRHVRTYSSRIKSVTSISFSPNGEYIIIGGGDFLKNEQQVTIEQWVFNPNLFLKKVSEEIAVLDAKTIAKYQLHRILDGGMWEVFLEKASPKQLHAFALFFAKEIAQNNNWYNVNTYYKKAQQCYRAARQKDDDLVFIKDEANMTIEWAIRLLYLQVNYGYASTELTKEAEERSFEALSLYQSLINETTRYNPQIKINLEKLVKQGLDKNIVSDFLNQLN